MRGWPTAPRRHSCGRIRSAGAQARTSGQSWSTLTERCVPGLGVWGCLCLILGSPWSTPPGGAGAVGWRLGQQSQCRQPWAWSPDGTLPRMALCSEATLSTRADCCSHVGWARTPEGLRDHGPCLTQEVAMRTVKQSSAVRETENGEEGEEEGAEFGEEDLFHQQVGPPGTHSGTHTPRTAMALLAGPAAHDHMGTTGLGRPLAPPRPLSSRLARPRGLARGGTPRHRVLPACGPRALVPGPLGAGC